MKSDTASRQATGNRARSRVADRPAESLTEQYSAAKILGVWGAAALPMGLLAWLIAPLVAARMDGPAPLLRALLVSITAGLIWQFLLVLFLVRRERGSLRWQVLRDALWLRAPRSPASGRAGGRLWLVLVPAALLFAAEDLLPTFPAPSGRDLAFLASGAGQEFISHNWVWLGVIVVLMVFNTVLGEELLFRGLLLPRMSKVCGRWDWVANGGLFALYHVHVPWAMPWTLLIDTFALAYPSRRYRSALIGIIVHSCQSLFFLALLLPVVVS